MLVSLKSAKRAVALVVIGVVAGGCPGDVEVESSPKMPEPPRDAVIDMLDRACPGWPTIGVPVHTGARNGTAAIYVYCDGDDAGWRRVDVP